MQVPKHLPFLSRIQELWIALCVIGALVLAGISWTNYLQGEIRTELEEERRFSAVQADNLQRSIYPATKGLVLEQQVLQQSAVVAQIYKKLEEIDVRQRKIQSTLDILDARSRQ